MAARRWFPRSAPGSVWSRRASSPLKKSESRAEAGGEKAEKDMTDSSSFQSEELTSGRGRRLNLRGPKAESAPRCIDEGEVLI